MNRLMRQASDVVRFVLYISLAIAVIGAAVHLNHRATDQQEVMHGE